MSRISLESALYLMKGRACRELGRFPEALQAFDQAIESEKTRSGKTLFRQADLEKGVTYLMDRQYGEAESTFKAVENVSDDLSYRVFARWGYATALTRQGRHHDAHQAWSQLCSTCQKPNELQNSYDARYQVARVFLDYFKNIPKANEFLSGDECIHIPTVIARIDLRFERMEASAKDIERKKSDYRMRAWNEAYEVFQRTRSSLDSIGKLAAQSGPGQFLQLEWRRQRAELQLIMLKTVGGLTVDEKKDLGNELQALLRSERIVLRQQAIRVMLGVFYGLQQDFMQAISYFENALQSDFDNADLRSSLAQCYHRSGRLRDARMMYSEVLAKAPGHLDALMGLGEVCLDLSLGTRAEVLETDLLEEADTYLSEALKPNLSVVSRQLSSRDTAALLYLRGYGRVKQWEADKLDFGKLDEALKDFKAAYGHYPENFEYRRAYEKVKQRRPRQRGQRWITSLAPLFLIIVSVGIMGLALYGRIQGLPASDPSPVADVLGKVVEQAVANDSLRQAYMKTLKSIEATGTRGQQRPISSTEFALLFFGGALLLIAGASLPQLLRFRIAGVELEKAATTPDVVATVGNVSLSRTSLAFTGLSSFSNIGEARIPPETVHDSKFTPLTPPAQDSDLKDEPSKAQSSEVGWR